MNDKVDIIIPWVDGNDSSWLEQKKMIEKKYQINHNANSNVRYESWNNLQYIFRAIENFMPWVNNVFLVTCGHLPDFIDTTYSKLKIIKHSDYIPEEYLPTFNSNVIELNYFRIPDLSETFILFNDDCFPLKPISQDYYFKNGVPCDEAIESPIMPVDIGAISHYASYVKANNVLFINKHFNKREVQERNWDKWYFDGYGELLERNRGLHYWNNFAGFHDYHMPVPLKKSTLKHLWDIEGKQLDIVSHNQFRSYSDLSQCIVRYWQLCTGDFVPQKSIGIPYVVTINNYKEVANAIRERKTQMICLSEDCTPEEFILIRDEINLALQTILPYRCKYEKG
ncbi:MAG: Stealth CR1 domain-containing protein [Lachnospiraceae bacterium]|nr:Stealth CR1 domain-containing protein [Lachnospiraceae bacterium]